MVQVLTRDETTAGGHSDGPVLELPHSEIKVRDLISLRVRSEVSRYNHDRPETFRGLVQPTDVETMLNGVPKRTFRPIDADRQVEVALQAFEKQGFVVLLPGGQAESLDETVRFADGDSVSFLRLVPLVGG